MRPGGCATKKSKRRHFPNNKHIRRAVDAPAVPPALRRRGREKGGLGMLAQLLEKGLVLFRLAHGLVGSVDAAVVHPRGVESGGAARGTHDTVEKRRSAVMARGKGGATLPLPRSVPPQHLLLAAGVDAQRLIAVLFH